MRTEHYYLYNFGESVKNEKQARYYKRIEQMLKTDIYRCYFLTFTFSDKTLQKTSQKTRLRHIKEFLNKQASDYVLNIDYGTEHQREHYHAFILSRYKVMLFKEYKHGHLDFKKAHDTLNVILTDRTNPSADNLTRHAFKETTKGAKIIYSRKSQPKRAITIKADRKLKDYQTSIKGITNKTLYNELAEQNKKYDAEREQESREIDEQLGIA